MYVYKSRSMILMDANARNVRNGRTTQGSQKRGKRNTEARAVRGWWTMGSKFERDESA